MSDRGFPGRSFRGGRAGLPRALRRSAAYNGASDSLRTVERFKPVPGGIDWSITLEDPRTWMKPWSFAMFLTHDESQPSSNTPATKVMKGCAAC